MYDLLGLLPGMLLIAEPGVAGSRVERELARIKDADSKANLLACSGCFDS
jgi:hypothetical protein